MKVRVLIQRAISRAIQDSASASRCAKLPCQGERQKVVRSPALLPLCACAFLTPVAMFKCHGGEQPVRHLSVARLSANSTGMNLRHAAALALVGWYLMIPPVSTDSGKAFVDSHAPIWQWGNGGTFGSTVDCEKAREKSQKNAENDEERNLETAARMDANLDNRATAKFEAARLMKCVSTDDPRLKGK